MNAPDVNVRYVIHAGEVPDANTTVIERGRKSVAPSGLVYVGRRINRANALCYVLSPRWGFLGRNLIAVHKSAGGATANSSGRQPNTVNAGEKHRLFMVCKQSPEAGDSK